MCTVVGSDEGFCLLQFRSRSSVEEAGAEAAAFLWCVREPNATPYPIRNSESIGRVGWFPIDEEEGGGAAVWLVVGDLVEASTRGVDGLVGVCDGE